MLPSPPDKVVFVGHSQGGHAALAAQSYAQAYGMQGTLVGVATFAPLWMSMSLFAAATTTPPGSRRRTTQRRSSTRWSTPIRPGELRGDPGTALDVFQTAKQQRRRTRSSAASATTRRRSRRSAPTPVGLLRRGLRQQRRASTARPVPRHRLHDGAVDAAASAVWSRAGTRTAPRSIDEGAPDPHLATAAWTRVKPGLGRVRRKKFAPTRPDRRGATTTSRSVSTPSPRTATSSAAATPIT